MTATDRETELQRLFEWCENLAEELDSLRDEILSLLEDRE